jgi:outer membrane lipoprotein-sorting protein
VKGSWLVVTCIVTSMATAQPAGTDILANLSAGFASIEDYTVSLSVAVDLDQLKAPPMQATMYFKQPDKVHFETEGFAMLPRESMGLNPGRLLARYKVLDVSEEMEGGAKLYKLTLIPKTNRNQLRELFLYVDGTRWIPERVVTPLDDRTVTAVFEHTQVEGRWLPSLLTVTFSSTEADADDSMRDRALPDMRRSVLPRSGSITIRYRDYKINTGLSDDVFDEVRDQPRKE